MRAEARLPPSPRSGLGLEAPRAAVHAFIGKASQHEFTEVESGKLSDRPELRKALDLAELSNATLIVAKLDRLSRDAEFLASLQKSAVRIVFADMPFADSFMIGIMAQVAQWEREQISKRTRAALQAAKARGARLGGDRAVLRVWRPWQHGGAQRSALPLLRLSQPRSCPTYARHAKRASAPRSIGAYLNRTGIKTSRRKDWTAER
jgi:hypothetical protein